MDNRAERDGENAERYHERSSSCLFPSSLARETNIRLKITRD